IRPFSLLPRRLARLRTQTSCTRDPNSILVFFHLPPYLTCPSYREYREGLLGSFEGRKIGAPTAVILDHCGFRPRIIGLFPVSRCSLGLIAACVAPSATTTRRAFGTWSPRFGAWRWENQSR